MSLVKKIRPPESPGEPISATPAQPPEDGTAAESSTPRSDFSWKDIPPQIAVGGLVLTAVFLWSYWPTLSELVATWEREPDYSHGYLVLPIALYALWVRRDQFPMGALQWTWAGLIVIGLSIGIRVFGATFFLGGVDGLSMLLWVAGACLLLGGWQFFWWSLPSVAFLWFMIPLPFQVERALRMPLQWIATKLSCWVLQFLGQPALSEGNTILLGENHLEVEEACSGLRIFVAIAVLAFAYIMVIRPSWWERVALIVAIVPIALISNVTRIVTTGLLYQFVSGEWAKTFSHDLAGWMMILWAGALFALLLWYMNKLYREVEVVDLRGVFRQRPGLEAH